MSRIFEDASRDEAFRSQHVDAIQAIHEDCPSHIVHNLHCEWVGGCIADVSQGHTSIDKTDHKDQLERASQKLVEQSTSFWFRAIGTHENLLVGGNERNDVIVAIYKKIDKCFKNVIVYL